MLENSLPSAGPPKVPKVLNQTKAVFFPVRGLLDLSVNRSLITDNPGVYLFEKNSNCGARVVGSTTGNHNYIDDIKFLGVGKLSDGKKVLNMSLDIYRLF